MHSPSLPQAEHIECATESKEITSLALLVTQMWWGVLVGKSSAQRKKVHHLRIKEKQFKTSTTAFLAEGSIEFFIVAKKKYMLGSQVITEYSMKMKGRQGL